MYLKIISFSFVIILGVFIFIYGGYDDSPGAQLLGLLIFISGIYGIFINRKKHKAKGK